jgi:hypothetical protein
MLPARLNVVTIGAHDVGRLERFYSALGWPASPASTGTWRAFDLGGAKLALFPREELAEDACVAVGSARERVQPYAGVTFAVNVESPDLVDSAIESVRSAGGRILKEPTTPPWGGRSAYFADPEGNVWEVYWGENVSFDEHGALVWMT